ERKCHQFMTDYFLKTDLAFFGRWTALLGPQTAADSERQESGQRLQEDLFHTCSSSLLSSMFEAKTAPGHRIPLWIVPRPKRRWNIIASSDCSRRSQPSGGQMFAWAAAASSNPALNRPRQRASGRLGWSRRTVLSSAEAWTGRYARLARAPPPPERRH